jgi:hypothetical protein
MSLHLGYGYARLLEMMARQELSHGSSAPVWMVPYGNGSCKVCLTALTCWRHLTAVRLTDLLNPPPIATILETQQPAAEPKSKSEDKGEFEMTEEEERELAELVDSD